MVINKAALLTSKDTTEELEIPGKGSVKVRGLTRAEVHANTEQARKKKLSDQDSEALMVTTGMVEPELNITEAREWMKTAPAGEVQLVVRKIMDLSGFGEDVVNEAYARFRDRG